MVVREIEVVENVKASASEAYDGYVVHVWRANFKIVNEGEPDLVGNTREVFASPFSGPILEKIVSVDPRTC